MRVPQFLTRPAAVASAVVLTSVLALSVNASSGAAAGPAQATAPPTAAAPAQPDANDEPSAGPVTPAFQVAGRTAEMQYVPVAPCVLMDTRKQGGPFGSGVTRSYNARGTGSLAGQGGSSVGCRLPQNAAVIAASVTALSPSRPGYLRLNASDESYAGITSVNYLTGSITGFANLNLSKPGSPRAFKITNAGGPTGVQVTVVGYYIAPMAARLDEVGSLILGSRVTSAREIPGFTGQYEVIFDRDVRTCYGNATAFTAGLIPMVQPRSGQPNGMFVRFFTDAGVGSRTSFYLTVSC